MLSITLSATLSNIWTSLKESFRSESRMWVILSRLRLRTMEKVLAPKDLPYIFDRFYRTDVSRNSSKGGSGIGLSIVKKILEDHGGKGMGHQAVLESARSCILYLENTRRYQ